SYFNEGGARLYVARVFGGDPAANTASKVALADANPANRITVTARFPGSGGNGTVAVREVLTAATVATMKRAQEGTMVKIADSDPQPAKVVSSAQPTFDVADGATLTLDINGDATPLTFQGKPAAITGTAALDPTVTVSGGDAALHVTVGDDAQTLTLASGTRQEIVDQINGQIRAGRARLKPTTNELILETDVRGKNATIAVTTANPTLHLTAVAVDTAADDPTHNNVGDLAKVSLADIQAILGADGVAVVEGGKLVFKTPDSGADKTISVTAVSAAGLLGFAGPTAGTAGVGSLGTNYYVLDGGAWKNGVNTLTLPSDAPSQLKPLRGSSFVTLTVETTDGGGESRVYEGLGLAPAHKLYVGHVLDPDPVTLSEQASRLYAMTIGATLTPFQVHDALAGQTFTLTGGDDGGEPDSAAYEDGLARLGGVEDISIIAAPGSSAYSSAQAVRQALIAAAEKRRSYRIAVVDTPAELGPQDAALVRAQMDSTRAALYYPWVVVANPLASADRADQPKEIPLPPSGFMCGIYARTDINRGVFKAPANEVIFSALRFESDINFAQQETLNPIAVNCLRYFPNRGNRVWGARTLSSDPEWKYVNVRRYFNFLERSIDVGTQWAVFEPNGERLWANIKDTISSFLENQWRSGALLGASTKEAFFVRCDRSTMDQNDLDNGRLVCLIGVAVVKPAEFVIFRIGQKTADARD
ncbi:MAG TPA: phage tail sheath subtilisin-like domain-containing protein, partial [Myxococcales bacterium]|nr:phage tail sheath subtilisin-like domain-containing protein [Myxococcales bacterium]